MNVRIQDEYKVKDADVSKPGFTKGEIEFIVRDRLGNIVKRWSEPNIVKIYAKEMLSHRLPSSEVWDPNANSGVGGWVASGIDPTEEFSARYIIFGASFDDQGLPLDQNDTRYYVIDPVTGSYVPIKLGPGADYEGSLINAIPLFEPLRPLKRVETIEFQSTYQPAGTPLLQSDVRALNNIVTLETTLLLDEYNGFGTSVSDYFTITEVALIGGKKLDAIGACDCTPRQLFLEGPSSSSGPLQCTASGSDVISIDPSETNVDLIKEGDSIKIVGPSDTAGQESISQVTPYYLVLQKSVGGRDITLDRTPVDVNNIPITGAIGVYRDTLRIFSHRILSTPVKKSDSFEITVRWSIIMS